MKNVFISRVNYLVAFAVAVVFNILTVGCTDDYDYQEKVAENRLLVPASKPAIPSLDFTFLRTDSVDKEKEFSTEWNSTETTTDTKVYGKLSVATSHQDGNAVMESELNKVIDLSYALEHTTYGELKSATQQYGGTTRGTYAMRVVAQLGDQGTMCYLDAENIIERALVRDTLRFFPADSILFGKAQVTNLRFVEKPATRAAESFIDKNDPRYVEVTWNVPVTRVHDKSSFTYDVEVKDNVVVFPIKKNDIVNVETDTLRVLVDPTIVNCVVRHNFTYKNGEKGKSEKSATIKCTLAGKPEWSENVSNTDFSFIDAERVKYGTPYTPAGIEQEGVSYLERVDEFTTVQGNGTELIKCPYTFKHQSVTIKDEYGVYEFGFVNPDFRQVSTKVVKVSETATLETARLFNTIEVSYLGGTQMGEETVLLNREIEEYVISDGLEKNTAKKTTLDDKAVFQISTLTKYSTGREVRKTATLEVERKAEVGQPWSSIEANTNHQSGDYVVTVVNRDQMTKTINGVKFTFVVVEKQYVSEVKLNGCTKKNSFKVIEVESCVANYGNDSYNFSDDEVKVNHTDNLTGGTEKDGFKVYNYTDKVSYTFGSNTKNFDLNGTIKVKAEEVFPEYLGKFILVRQSVTMNETRDGYLYVLSAEFTNGYVVPGFIKPGSTKIDWRTDITTKVEGKTNRYNSAVYTSNGWINCTAQDVLSKNYMVWYVMDTDYDQVTFSEAESLNWDNGYKKDGHCSVYTNRFKISINQGVMHVVDGATGNNLGTYADYTGKI